MCGRYWIDGTKIQIELKDICNVKMQGVCDVNPGTMCSVLEIKDEKIVNNQYMWGIQGKNGLIINARAESVFEKQLFHEGILKHRILIPCSGFYEWSSSKQKYRFTSHETLLLAGIVINKQFAILTKQANAIVSPVHHRMPVIIEKNEIQNWLENSHMTSQLLQKDCVSLYTQTDFEQFSLF